MTSSTSKPRTVASLSADRLRLLNAGEDQSRTLAECLAVDFVALARASLHGAPRDTIRSLAKGQDLGILRRMEHAGVVLLKDLGRSAIGRLQKHPSDTVRGWACFMIGARPDLDLADRLEAIKPFADDGHFGVREWAWMAVRPHLARDVEVAIALLSPWTGNASARLRRFASEAMRPRGVWCGHIGVLKETPQLALPVLEPLKADPEIYVQDSVSNWLNDAYKDQPDWVQSLCRRWQSQSANKATARICSRALRSAKPKEKPKKMKKPVSKTFGIS